MLSFLTKILGQPHKSLLRQPEADFVVGIRRGRISCTRPDGTVESVDLADVAAIEVRTNRRGPFLTDVFYVLLGPVGGCVVPVGATNETELLDLVLKLPGFDSRRFSEAMASTEDSVFPVWRREP
jgi:hypothetical protein